MSMANSGTNDEAAIAAWLDKYLRGKGFSGANLRAAEAGFLGNFQVESGFRHEAYNPGENAHGYAQWENGRWAALQSYAAAHHLAPTSQAAELGYLGQELSGPYSGVIAQLRGLTSPTAAAHVIDRGFEGSAGTTQSERATAAAAAYSWLGGVGGSLADFLPTDPSTGAVPGTPSPSGADRPPPLPYPADSLTPGKTSLSSVQRTRIIDWLESVGNTPAAIVKWLNSNSGWPGVLGTPDLSKYEQGKYGRFEGIFDEQLIYAYNAVAKGGGVGYGDSAIKYEWHPPSWLTSPANAIIHGVEDVLSWMAKPLVNFLIAAALVIAGALFVLLAVKMIGDTDDNTSSAAPAPREEEGADVAEAGG